MAPSVHSPISTLLLCTQKAFLMFLMVVPVVSATLMFLMVVPVVSATASGLVVGKPTATFCSEDKSQYFLSSPVVTQSELSHFLKTVSDGAAYEYMERAYLASSYVSNNRTMYGVAQCRPDVPNSYCAACLAASTQSIANSNVCTATAVWRDFCFLRYSDSDTRSFNEQEYTGTVFNSSGVLHGGRAVVIGLLDAIINSTFTPMMYIGGGTGRTAASGSVYSLAQCIPGIELADCARCLRGALAAVEREFNGSAGMQVLRLSCTTRYEIYPFYNSSLLSRIGMTTVNWNQSNRTAVPNGRDSPPPGAHPTAPGPQAPPHAAVSAQPRARHRRTRKTVFIIIALSAIGIAIGVNLVFLWFLFYRRQRTGDIVGENVCSQRLEHLDSEDEHEDSTTSCQSYNYKILEVATCRFSNSNKLGSGGFATVYKGRLENGTEVAVKRLKESKRSLPDLEREVSIVAKLRHKNLVRFLGYCFEDEGRLLVYEYLPNNSLHNFWNKASVSSQFQKLNWEVWFNIMEGVARGLRFLHKKGIIHRDLKSHNVLLDNNFNPKIADFDLIRVYNKDKTHESTEKAAGTCGYMAPECTSGRKFQFSIKSDVYSYGVLVLEIITRHKIYTFEGNNFEGLVEYVWQHWTEGRVPDVVDDDLGADATEQGRQQALRCVHVALLCVQSDQSRRPTMDEVISMVSAHENTELPAPSLPGYLHPRSSPGLVLRRRLPCFGRT